MCSVDGPSPLVPGFKMDATGSTVPLVPAWAILLPDRLFLFGSVATRYRAKLLHLSLLHGSDPRFLRVPSLIAHFSLGSSRI